MTVDDTPNSDGEFPEMPELSDIDRWFRDPTSAAELGEVLKLESDAAREFNRSYREVLDQYDVIIDECEKQKQVLAKIQREPWSTEVLETLMNLAAKASPDAQKSLKYAIESTKPENLQDAIAKYDEAIVNLRSAQASAAERYHSLWSMRSGCDPSE